MAIQAAIDLGWMLTNNRIFLRWKALELLTYVLSQCPEPTAVILVTPHHSSMCASLSESTRFKDPQVQGSSLIHVSSTDHGPWHPVRT